MGFKAQTMLPNKPSRPLKMTIHYQFINLLSELTPRQIKGECLYPCQLFIAKLKTAVHLRLI